MQNSYYFDMVHVLAFMMMWRYFTKQGADVIAHCFDCVRGWRGVRWAVFGGDVKYEND